MGSWRDQKSPTSQLKSLEEEESTLPLIPKNRIGIRLSVKIPLKGKTVAVKAKAYHTIQYIKAKVGRMIGMSVFKDYQIMIYAGQLLEDCKTLAFYDVKGECMFEMFPRLIRIFVKTPSQKIVRLAVEVLFTIHDVKTMVWGKTGSSVSNEDLFYAGKKLEDSKTVSCYAIRDKSVLELLPPHIQIFVKTWNGKTVTLDVLLSNTTKDVKDKLFDKLKIPVKYQNFVFAGKQLVEDRDLASYNVQKHSTLELVFSPHEEPLKLSQPRADLSESLCCIS
ncbi:hypothetical protein ACOSP7_006702 [Xanthoceras sorbifolium]|uniref:Ubiquitin-like domain-containing protein n=1 Tax=Xanthoceras sorbifolium TaxID=99658 RepID=A0ABQ8I9H7_9ROSI|nr:hypothetical protein JRO89_XS03G0090100 [Xanthoceras sorbifolium]